MAINGTGEEAIRQSAAQAEQVRPDASGGRAWPEPLDPAAFHGLAGRFVRMVAPHTEADPAALLVQFLDASGNVIGRNVYRVAEGASHYPNLFAVIVGETGHGRKGSSFAWVRR